MLSSIRDGPRLIDKKIFRGFSLSAVHECSRQTAKSTRRKSNRIQTAHQLLNSDHSRSCDYSIALCLLVVIKLSAIGYRVRVLPEIFSLYGASASRDFTFYKNFREISSGSALTYHID